MRDTGAFKAKCLFLMLAKSFARISFLIMFLGLGAHANPVGPALDGRIIFRDTLDAQSTLKIALGHWTEKERAPILKLFHTVAATYPGFFARATAAGPISLYRTAEDSPDHPSDAWARRRHEASIIFRDSFFRSGRPNHLGVEYSYWLFVHELSHLSDPVDEIGQSPRWRLLMEPRIAKLSADLAQTGLTVRKAMFQYKNKIALADGFPSTYAATSLHEALAEYAAVYAFKTDFKMPPEVLDFLQSVLFAPPSPRETQDAKLYRSAYLAYRSQDFASAEADLSAALNGSPEFGMGYFLRGYVRAKLGRLREADNDWASAERLIPESDVREQRDLAKARRYVHDKLKE